MLVGVLRRLLIAWAGNVVALFVAAGLIDGIDYGGDWVSLVIAALVFSLVNAVVRPIVFVLSLPLIVLTLGIALFFVNLLMLYVTDWLVPDFRIDSFGAAIGGTIIVWIVNALLSATVFKRAKERERGDRRD
jgi:putative membrane protein